MMDSTINMDTDFVRVILMNWAEKILGRKNEQRLIFIPAEQFSPWYWVTNIKTVFKEETQGNVLHRHVR